MKIEEDPVFVVDADGMLIIAVGYGSKKEVVIRADDKTMIAQAEQAATRKEKVNFIYGASPLVAGWDTKLGILAALLAVRPGRSIIKEAPPELIDILQKLSKENSSF